MSHEKVGVSDEQLEDLAWDAPLTLMRRDSYPEELWMLEQRGRRVAAITRTTRWPPDGGWSLTTAAQHWNADIRRRRRRVGWHVEVTPSRARAPVLEYRPGTVRNGGTLELATGGRYKLRCFARLGYDWSLATTGGDRLARITRRISPPSGSAIARDRSGLTPAAADEPDLGLLLAAASVAIVINYQRRDGGGGGGG
jgi:hypothetical protein